MSNWPQTMTPSWSDDERSGFAPPCIISEFTTDLLETPLSGVHSNVDDNEGLHAAPTSAQIHTPARLVVGARDDRLLPGYQRNIEDGGSFIAATKILAQEFDPPMQEAEGHVAVIHSECRKYLSENGPTFMTGSDQTKETTCAVLYNMAEHVKVLSPANDPIPTDIVLNMCHWEATLLALVEEMRTVEEAFPSLSCSSGVYVLTSSSYAAFLRALAAEIADRPSACRFPSPA